MNRSADEALRLAVDALGGDKAVGARLWPEMHPVLAGQRIAHCLDPERREKLSLEQTVFVFLAAKQKGRHDGFNALAELCGYHVVAVLDPAEEMAEIARKASAAASDAIALSTELQARMKAAGMKIDA